MVDIIQVPAYPESIIFYIFLSTLIVCLAALVGFIIVLFRRDYKSVLSRMVKMDESVQNLKNNVRNVDVYAKNQTNVLNETLKKDMEGMRNFIVSSTRDDTNKIMFFMEKNSQLEVELSNVKSDMRKLGMDVDERYKRISELLDRVIKSFEIGMNIDVSDKFKGMEKRMGRQMNKRYKDIALFFLMRIFDELSTEIDHTRIAKRLDDLKFFVDLSKRNRYWDRSLEKTSIDFLKGMERQWKSTSEDIAMLYSVSLEKIKGKE